MSQKSFHTFLHAAVLLCALLCALLCSSCASNRQIPQGASRLVGTKISVEGKEVQPAQLTPYLKQKGEGFIIFGVNPFKAQAVIYDSLMVGQSKRNMQNYLEREGWYNSRISDSVVTAKRKSKVFYNVKLGKRYIISRILYNIEDSLLLESADTLNSLLRAGEYLSSPLLEREAQRIVANYRNKGFFDFNDGYISFVADTLKGDGNAELTVNIMNYMRNSSPLSARPHKRYRFGSINATTVLKPTRDYLTAEDSAAMALSGSTSYKNIKMSYSGKKPLVNPKLINRMSVIMPDSLYSDTDVARTYNRLSAIKMFGNINLSTKVSPSDTGKVDVDIDMQSSALQGLKFTFEASMNSSAFLGLSPGVNYHHKNIFGGGEVFNIGFTGSFQFKVKSPTKSNEFGVTTQLSIPRFSLFGDKIFKGTTIPSTEISLAYNYQQRPEYTRNIISGSFGLAWNKRGKYYYNINLLQANVVKIYNMSETFYDDLKDPFLKSSYQDHFDIGVGGSFLYTTDNSVPHNKSYFYLRASMDLSGNLLGLFNGCMAKNSAGEHIIWSTPYAQYARTEISAVYTWRFGRNNKSALAARALFGIGKAYGNSISLPFEKLFWSGGPYGLRGWLARSVGPGYAERDTTFSIANQTGDMKLEANLEYRFPLFSIFEGALFVDAGNVWRIKSYSGEEEGGTSSPDPGEREKLDAGLFRFNDFYRHIALDWGTGLRINLGFTLIRFDVGFKTFDPEQGRWMGFGKWFREKAYTVQFGIDYPF